MRLKAPWVDEFFHWGSLRALGNSRLVTSSIVWLFIVPIAAKLLAPFAGQHTLDLSWFDPDLNEPIAVTIALPFSWQRFYLMSWLFVIGQIVYWLACPEIVRKYSSFGAYRADHAGAIQLMNFVGSVLDHGSSRSLARFNDFLLDTDIDEPGRVGQAIASCGALRYAVDNMLRISKDADSDVVLNRLFDGILLVERLARPVWFWVSGVFFTCGLALFGWVVLEGIVEVCKLL